MDDDLVLDLGELEDAHWWFSVRRRIVVEELARSMPEDARVLLEVGCGTGGMLAELEGMGDGLAITGVEPSEAARVVAAGAGHKVEPGTFEQLPVEDRSLDALIALDVLEHCSDDAVALAEAARALRPGGLLFLTVPALQSLWSPHDEANRHFRRYAREELAALVSAHGFAIERVTYFNTLLLPLAYGAKAGARAVGRKGLVGARQPWGPVNAALSAVFGLEITWLRAHPLPVGVSLMLSARRSPDDTHPPSEE
jgi:SAM-dependent methyltransferase